MVHPIPDSVSFEDGAMMEPLSVGVHSVANLGEFKSDQVCPGRQAFPHAASIACTDDQVCIVFGAGPVGLLCMAVAKALGARRVIAVDIQQDRLDFAKSYAATDIYLPVCHFFFSPTSFFYHLSFSNISYSTLHRVGGIHSLKTRTDSR